MNRILTFFFALLVTSSFAQKKMTPITQSSFTGIRLPSGSKQDSRMLSVAGAKMLLEIESKKTNINLSSAEVLVLPPVTLGGFNSDSLLKNFTDLGWAISVIESDQKYAWLQKDGRTLIMYFSMDAKETKLYFAEASSAPAVNLNENTSGTIQTTSGETNRLHQTTDTVVKRVPAEIIHVPAQPVENSGFAFTSTNFDDGWTSTVWDEWVQVAKRDIKVLIHYPNKTADAYNSVLLDGLKNAWDVLVAPKYSSASNFYFKPLFSWQSIEFAEADMTETATGKTVHVVLFKKNFNNGGGRYLEFVTPSKNVFEQEFGAYDNSALGSVWDKMANMAGYNKFAVAASDLTGKWTSDFTGMTQYVNAFTGADAGANTHASNESFEFGSDRAYKWDLGVASGFIGSIKFQSAKSNGKFTIENNWQVNFSDIEGKPKTYAIHFSCIKGARVLWIGQTGFGKKM